MTQQVSIIQVHILIYEMIYIWSQHQPLRPLLLHLLSPLRFVLRQSPGRNSKVSWSGPQKKTAMNIIPGLPLLQLQRDWGCCIFFCGLFHCRPQNLDGHKDLDAGVENLSARVKGFTSTPNWTVAGTWQHGKQCSLDVDIEKQIFDSKPKSRLCFHFNPITESDRHKLIKVPGSCLNFCWVIRKGIDLQANLGKASCKWEWILEESEVVWFMLHHPLCLEHCLSIRALSFN